MGNMEEGSLDLLNMDQEDDNLLGVSAANSEACSLGVSPLSPSMMSKALKQAVTEDLENCYGKGELEGVLAVVGADLDVNMAPLPCRSPMAPSFGSKVLSVLNVNEMNKRNVNRDVTEEFKSRKGFGIRESMQLDGIAETSPVKNPGTFTSQLSRSYLDIENEQAGGTPEKGGGEPTVLRKSRSRRSTTLRKSLAWDKAFFTEEGVLDNDELFAVATDTPKTFAMPELATIWDGPQNLVSSFEAKTAAAKTNLKSEPRPELRSELRPELRPEVRPAVDVPKPQQDVSHTSSLRPDVLHTSSLRPVRQIHTAGSHAFSNAYSRAAAIPPGSTSIPLPSSLTRTGKQPGVAVRHPTEHAHGTGADMKESRNTTAGLHHQARIAALKKAHEAPPQKGPRVRLPNSISNKKVEEKHLEETYNKVKQFKKVENKSSDETPKMNVSRETQTPKQVDDKPSKDTHKTYGAYENQPALTRSMSTSSLLESPSALSRKVSSMSKRVKETLGKVMAGRARRVPKEPSLSHVHPVEKTSSLPKRTGALPTVTEVKDPNHRTRSNAVVAPIRVNNKQAYTVRDILRGKGPPSSPKAASKQGPTLTRSKSACAGVPGLPRANDPGLAARVIVSPAAPSTAPSAPPPPPPPVQHAEPLGKPTGLRKPSPKLGFFDAGRASSAPQKAFAISQPFNCMRNNQPFRPGSEASTPIGAHGHRSHGLPPAKAFSAIPTAPHLRHGMVASAPTSPRSIPVMQPSSPKGSSTISMTTSSSPTTIECVDNPVNFSAIRHAEQFAESHQLLATKRLLGDETGTDGIAPEVSTVDSIKLPNSLVTSAGLNMELAELGNGKFARSFAESNPLIPPAVNPGGSAHSGTSLESGGGESGDIALITSLREAMRSDDKSSSRRYQNSRSEPGENRGLDDRHVPGTLSSSTQDTDDDILEKIVSSGAREMSVAPNELSSSSQEQQLNSLRSPSGSRNNGMAKPITSLREAMRSDDKSSELASQRSHNSRSEPGENSVLDSRHVLGKLSPSTQDTDDDILEKIVSSRAKELSVAPNELSSSSLEQPNSLRSSSSNNGMSKPTGLSCCSPHSSSFREIPTAAVGGSSKDTAVDNDIPPSACPTTPTSKERSHVISAKISRQFESPRSKSSREIPLRPNTTSDSPASKHVRSFSQRIPWQSPGGTALGDASPTPASGGKRHSYISPSHAPDAAGTFEVLTPISSKTAPRCVRTPGSSSKKVIRKIVEFESPSSQWSNWPVLGAAISADQLPGSGTKEGLSSTPPRPSSGEQATEQQSTELRANSSANLLSTPTSKVRHTELDRAANENCILATEQSTDSRLSFSDGFVSTPTNFSEMESGCIDRNPAVGLDGAEACGSAKKERRSSMFSFAKKAVARLTSSPTPAEPSGQDNEGIPKSLRKTSRRFSNCPAPEPKPLPLFSEARICELEAAGPEILQKKNGPVQNSPPDKPVPDSNPWSPVKKNGQPLGPFDCTKLKYISPGLVNS